MPAERPPRVPRYPIFIPSKGRADPTACLTARFMLRDGVPFHLVVEPSEEAAYRDAFPEAPMLVMPRDNMRLLGARNWIADYSVAQGDRRHWQFDDNIGQIARWHQGRRIRINSAVAICAAEEFTDRYTNIGLSGFNYDMFAVGKAPPFRVNAHVYSSTLVNNEMPYRWRLLYNDDTDLCLQVLSGGLCTVQINAFVIKKLRTMVVRGGNTDDLYQGDGRLLMARTLERVWPGVVTTTRKFGRPQHQVDWQKFKGSPRLIRREDLDWSEIQARKWTLTRRDQVKEPGDEEVPA